MTGDNDLEPTPLERLEEAFIDTDEMREFLAAREKAAQAAERGESEVVMPAALIARIFDITQPHDLAHLRHAWNRVCDEQGMPGEKKPEPAPIEYETGKGLF
jgi:hypothetical protein